METLEIIQIPYAIVMVTPIVVLTLGILGFVCWLAGIFYQKYTWNKIDKECDIHDSMLYTYLSKQNRIQQVRIQALLSGIKRNIYPIQPSKVSFYKITNSWMSKFGLSNYRIRLLG